jgi:hypothetical protein
MLFLKCHCTMWKLGFVVQSVHEGQMEGTILIWSSSSLLTYFPPSYNHPHLPPHHPHSAPPNTHSPYSPPTIFILYILFLLIYIIQFSTSSSSSQYQAHCDADIIKQEPSIISEVFPNFFFILVDVLKSISCDKWDVSLVDSLSTQSSTSPSSAIPFLLKKLWNLSYGKVTVISVLEEMLTHIASLRLTGSNLDLGLPLFSQKSICAASNCFWGITVSHDWMTIDGVWIGIGFTELLQVVTVSKDYALTVLHTSQITIGHVRSSQNYWVFGLCPLSGILETRKHSVSKFGSVSVLSWGRDTYSVGSLRKS